MLGRGTFTSYSQFGEDAVLNKILPDKGFYVDVGAYHPHLYSNTYALYKKGWRGVAIDPNPKMKKLFAVFRPRDHFVNVAIGTDKEMTYFSFTDGAYNTLNPENAREHEKKTKLISRTRIRCAPLHTFLIGIEKIDFLNIDAEGQDVEILETYDWKIHPKVIAVEGEAPILESKGYQMVGKAGLTNIWKLK
jgi:FkbM family methyltransferase